ncbi:methyltransferase [Stakelama pacifica]|uniref:Methyltransferase n=1 Tax=Stakelama pacifica TaxID=517720 RepID=A0A4V3BTD8_9SPHN|nr:methyltransferase [Stakelama pacifica]TDN82998.1 hypothetical protein EV664_105196 [Stakelama pacifica]GGO94972.1 hypothetical protein GCM10011329_18060 [Stakelama pacifica]
MNTPNRSTAVMQRRCVAPDELDDFPTPPWATRAVLRWLAERSLAHRAMTCREPAANRGYMVKPLAEFFASVDASDVHDYGVGFPVRDYLFGAAPYPVDWTFCNPPFRLAEQFIARARDTSRAGVAMILRGAFEEGTGRYERLYSRTPPDFKLVFTERVVMLRGRLVRAGEVDPFAEKPGTKASTATSYNVFIWLTDGDGDTRVRWIPPCRLEMEREGDYPDYGIMAANKGSPGLFATS